MQEMAESGSKIDSEYGLVELQYYSSASQQFLFFNVSLSERNSIQKNGGWKFDARV